MDANLNIPGNAFFKRSLIIDRIAGIEADKILHLIVEDFAVPYIMGLSLETISEFEYVLKTGAKSKPPPLSATIKIRIYQKIFLIFEQRLKQLIIGFIRQQIECKYYYLDSKELEKLVSPTVFPITDFSYRNILSVFKRYINQNYSYDSAFIISAVEYERSKFLPNIYELARLNEILH